MGGGANSNYLIGESLNKLDVGSLNSIGLKGFYWFGYNSAARILYLTDRREYDGSVDKSLCNSVKISDYWSVGDLISIHSAKGKVLNAATITNIYDGEGSASYIVLNKDLGITDEDFEGGHITDDAVFVFNKPNKGEVDFGEWSTVSGTDNKANNYAVGVFGRDNIAKGQYAFIGGRQNEAGYAGAAFGRKTYAIGDAAFTAGNLCYAEGKNASSLGRCNHSSGWFSFTANSANKVYGKACAALNGSTADSPNTETNDGNTVYGTCNLAIGHYNTINDNTSFSFAGGHGSTITSGVTTGFAFGQNAKVKNSNGVAIGYGAVAGFDNTSNDTRDAQYGIAIGNNCKACNYATTAIGINNTSNATGSVTLGVGCTSVLGANNSIVAGHTCTANGACNIVMGRQLIGGTKDGQAVFGRFNAQDNEQLFIIGNGTSNSARSNIVTVNNYGMHVGAIASDKLGGFVRNIHVGTSSPDNDEGQEGDIYIMYSL